MTYRKDRNRAHPRLQDRPIKVERVGDRYFGSMPTPEIKGLKMLWSNEASADDARNAIVAAYATLVGSANLADLNKRRARARAKYAKQKETANGVVCEAN